MAHTKIVDGKRWADGSLSRYRVDELTYEMWSEIIVEMGFKYKAPIFHTPLVHSKDHKLQIRLEGLTVTIQLKGESYPISFDRGTQCLRSCGCPAKTYPQLLLASSLAKRRSSVH